MDDVNDLRHQHLLPGRDHWQEGATIQFACMGVSVAGALRERPGCSKPDEVAGDVKLPGPARVAVVRFPQLALLPAILARARRSERQ